MDAIEHDYRPSGPEEPIPTAAGVYVIVNTASSLRYVGQAANLRARKSAHWNAARQYDPPHLRHDWRMFGPAAFAFVVLVREPDARVRREIEGGLIDEWGTWDPRRGYNLTFGKGDRAPLARLYLYESRLVKKRAFQYLPGVSIHAPVQYDYLERWEQSLSQRA
jgi:hypothetical protein